MTKINLSDFRRPSKKLLPEHLTESPMTATIASVEHRDVPDSDRPGTTRPVTMLTFQEFGPKVLFLNMGQLRTLVDRFGADDATWIGQAVVIERHVALYGGAQYHKVRISPEGNAGALANGHATQAGRGPEGRRRVGSAKR